jgi:hypothetical protein
MTYHGERQTYFLFIYCIMSAAMKDRIKRIIRDPT